MDEVRIFLTASYEEKDGIERLISQCQLPANIKAIALDFYQLRFIEVGPLALLLGFIINWRASGLTVNIYANFSSSSCSYLSRINFFEHISEPVEEQFKRHKSGDRFVEFKKIDSSSSSLLGLLSDQIATCVAGENSVENDEFTDRAPVAGYYEAIAYSVSELIKNVQQHASGIGFVVAQHYPTSGKTHIAIVDSGIGIKESFFRSGSPHASRMKTDIDALKIALEAEVSSRTHNTGSYGTSNENAGVGLTLLTHIAQQAGGSYQLLSGNGFLQIDEEKTLPVSFQGTFFCLTFNRSKLDDFGHLLENAKIWALGEPDSELDKESEDIFK